MPKRKPSMKSRKGYRRKQRTRMMKSYKQGLLRNIPVKNVAKMRYVSGNSISSTGVGVGYHQFRANSIQDPDLTGVGHQPMGHDQYSQFYNHYVVLGAKITVYYHIALGNESIMAGCFLNDNATNPYTDYEKIMEARRGQYVDLHHSRNEQVTETNYSAKGFFSVKDVKDNLNRLGAAFGSNPTEEAIFTVWAQPVDFTTPRTIAIVAVIDYIVQFSEPKELSSS